MDGVWLIWGDRRASAIPYVLFMSTAFAGIYSEPLATAVDCGIFAFCGVGALGCLWLVAALCDVRSPVDRIA